LSRSLFENWSHHPAEATPRSPEIDQKWQITIAGVSFETGRRQWYRMSIKQCGAATAALAALWQSGMRDAIDNVAVRANDMQEFVDRHGEFSKKHSSLSLPIDLD
jgi:hypothetical protein